MVSSPRVITRVVDQIRRERAEMIACFVISDRIPESVSSWLIYIGFMGDKPSGELKSAITDNYRRKAENQLQEIERVAGEKGIPYRSVLVEGDIAEEGSRLAKEEKVDLILLNQPERSHFFRLIFGSLKEDLCQRVTCPVEVVDEEVLEA